MTVPIREPSRELPVSTVLPPLARRPVLVITAAVALVLLATSWLDGYFFDELYFITAGRYHLSVSYADQPPLVPALAGLLDTLAPGAVPVLRLPAVLASAASVLLTALMARELGGQRRAQVLAAGAYAVSFNLLVVGHWLATYSIDPVWWILITWLLMRWVRVRDDRLLLCAGLVTALSLQTKYLIVAFWVITVLAVLVLGPRKLLRRPLLWIGMGAAALATLPSVAWQAGHGWPQLQMGRVVAHEVALGGGRLSTLAGIVVSAGSLVAIVLCGYGLWRLLRSPDLRPYRFLGVTVLGTALAIVLMPGRAYYAMGLYPVLLAAATVELQRHRPAIWWRWVPTAPVYVLSAVVSVAGLLLLTITGLRPAAQIWPRLADTVARSYHALPADEQRHTAILADSYPFAAAIDHFGPQHGLPLAYSGYRGYGYFDPPPAILDAVLYVGGDPGVLRAHFTEVREVTPAHPTFDAKLWWCQGQRTPWPTLWPQLRRMQ
ncbi:MAG TPA: glycosyltransferase family 39 protein [Pseudonocardiaceae bacterium]